MKMNSLSKAALAVALLLLAVPRAARAEGGATRINGVLAIPADDAVFDADDEGDATLKGNVQSAGGEMAKALQKAVRSGTVPLPVSRESGIRVAGPRKEAGTSTNVQVNDPALDHVVTFNPSVVNTRPFEFSTNSETSVVQNGQHIVVGYNSSAGAVVEFFPGAGLFFTQLLFSAVSTSHDGGRTWTSGFVPPVSPDSPFTFGDPSLAMDRNGAIYRLSLGTDEVGNSSVNINRSTDNGTSFEAGIVVVRDDGSDKEWLAIGPDPSSAPVTTCTSR